MPVPEPDILQRGLIVGWIRCSNGGLSGKLTLSKPVKAICLAGHLNVMSDVRLLANELVGLDDEAADIPADYTDRDITNHGGSSGCNEPAPGGPDNGAGNGDYRS